MESPPTNLHSTIGAYQIGVLISYMCFGVTTTQAYIYYSRFPDDSRKLKALVAFVWWIVLAMINLRRGLTVHLRPGWESLAMPYALVTHYTGSLYSTTDTRSASSALPRNRSFRACYWGSMAVTAVQVYFAFRLYQLSKKLQIAIVSWTLSFVRQLAALTIFVIALRPIPVAIYDPKWRWLFLIYWSASSTNDLTITGAFAVMLTAQRSHVSARTRAVVDKLRGWSIETRMLPTLCGMATLACYVANSENFIWLGMFAISTRMYATCFLASLIYRTTLRTMDEVPMSFSSAATEPSSNVQITKELEFAHFDSSRGQLSGASPRQ
ncbi:hypothetical protein B0H14DRAFT_3158051 [Mycena olivaceomarginata]|nr:hypothetical protein B0H14DRAFT_3158051 [Mycena olivaceomarginata]